ncbi:MULTISPECIES: hypothetical protein [unclassified Frondihabitans]|uniref:hypothetical protein n=1 Tax=unclassified Frondihabitans TaxID=2626248 RepID=UPI000F512EB5|nr:MULTISPECIES: hypothetical protein [unclassified Frondihabitans]RPE77877.1 hypothetical protein EDF37_0542 [Frondihabitans sp. PhB153]RPF08156.1 hypothetical protein EDF39_0543 [Frondihabitans sp. PhB161]
MDSDTPDGTARSKRQKLAAEAFKESADEPREPPEVTSQTPSENQSQVDYVANNSGIPEALKYFLLFHPATSFFAYLAEREFGHLMKPAFREKKISAPVLYWACVSLDLLWLSSAVVGVFVVAARVIFKGFFT